MRAQRAEPTLDIPHAVDELHHPASLARDAHANTGQRRRRPRVDIARRGRFA
jgi:hypothetical protein